jgi:hypothetical protein
MGAEARTRSVRDQQSAGVEGDLSVTRRSLLAYALVAWAGGSSWAGEPDQSQSEDDEERRAVEAIAAKAGLQKFGATRSTHYLGIGDTTESLRSQTLRVCETVAAEYLDDYQSRGFKVAMPARRLTVIILADEVSRSAFQVGPRVPGIPIDVSGLLVPLGHYEPSTNRVVLSVHARGSRSSGLLDSRLAAHEVTHQLTYNTGILDRRGDVPRSITEGLAEYGKIRYSTKGTPPGQLHSNLLALVKVRKARMPWYPFIQLLADDRPFLLDSFKRLQSLAYAQAWLLIHYLMNDPSRRERFRAYLEAIRQRTDSEYRLDDAEKHLGNLDRLDQNLVDHFISLNRSV